MDTTALRRLAGHRGVALGILEKDQAITVALGFLAGLPAVRSLVFKGGTALNKIYFPAYRLSEDLDFTASADVTARIVRAEPRLLAEGVRTGVRFVAIERIPGGRAGRSLRIRFEDVNGHPNSIRVEVSLRETVRLPAERRPLLDPYHVLSGHPFLPTMDLREIAAEKVRALCMRSQPRDLYDLAFLLDHRVPLSRPLIEAKLSWWQAGMRLEDIDIRERLARLEGVWERDLAALLGRAPSFATAAAAVQGALAKASRESRQPSRSGSAGGKPVR